MLMRERPNEPLQIRGNTFGCSNASKTTPSPPSHQISQAVSQSVANPHPNHNQSPPYFVDTRQFETGADSKHDISQCQHIRRNTQSINIENATDRGSTTHHTSTKA